MQIYHAPSHLRHVLLVWELGGNWGHLARLHLLATALQERGIQVTFAVRDRQLAEPWLAARGWPCVQAPHTTASARMTVEAVSHADWFLSEGFGEVSTVHQLVSDWAALVAHLRVDGILLDFAPAATYAAHFLQIPYAVSSVGFCAPAEAGSGCFRPWDAAAAQRAADAQQRCAAAFAQLRSALGAHAADSVMALYTDANLRLCTFAELDHFADRSVAVAYTGVLWNDEAQPVAHWPAARSGAPCKKVFCYLNGSTQDVMAMLWVLQAQQHDVVAVVPRLSTSDAAQYTSPHFQVFSHSVDLRSLLPGCDAVVTHGGVGLAGQSLCAGVPLLVLPMQAEQALLARRIAQQKLGAATHQLTNTALLAGKLDAVLHDDAVKLAAQQFAARYAGYSTRQGAVASLTPWV